MHTYTTLLATALLLGGQSAANPTIDPTSHVRAHEVLTHLESIQHPIEWTFIDNTTQLASFDVNEWNAWEAAVVNAGNATSLNSAMAGDLFKRDPGVLCYGSGSWARDQVLAYGVGAVCKAFAYGVSEGSHQILKKTGLFNEAGDRMTAVYTFTKLGTSYVGSNSCSGVLTHLINEVCQGKNKDTRGGTSSDGNAKFGVDPTTDNCNC